MMVQMESIEAAAGMKIGKTGAAAVVVAGSGVGIGMVGSLAC